MAAAADEEEFQEVDPMGRFGRYSAVLGSAPSRRCTVVRLRPARAEENIEVARNLVRLRTLDPAMVDRLHAEVRLLRSLHHDHIIVFHKVWLDRDAGVLNFFAEVCNSGSLCEDRDRHKHVSVKTQESVRGNGERPPPSSPCFAAENVHTRKDPLKGAPDLCSHMKTQSSQCWLLSSVDHYAF